MRRLVLFVCVCTLMLGTLEGRSAVPTVCDASRALDRAAQEAAVRQLASMADVIGIARSTFESTGNSGYLFTRVLKGARKPGIEFQFRRRPTEARAQAATGFCVANTRPGQTYLLYAINGEVVRAVPESTKRDVSLSFNEELAVITQALQTPPSVVTK